jgi:mycothiol synthase
MRVAEPLHVGGVKIETVDYRSLTDEQIRLLNAFENVVRTEVAPEDPPRPLDQTDAEVRTMPDYIVVREVWGMDPDGALAAQGFAWWTTKDNLHAVNIGLEVRPDRRRRGIGKAMFALLVSEVEAEGRSLIMGTTSSRAPDGEAVARRVGAKPAMATHTNRLDLARVDRDLVRRWIDEGPVRAPDYELFTIDGPYPDERLDAIVDLMGVMNTAPIDDLDLEDRVHTPEEVRAWERTLKAAGTQRWALFARHASTGDLVGYTEVRRNPAQPKTIWQGDTAVRPDHRGHALGKWLKATMLERILTEAPDVEDIRTGNADSNAPMLGINHALGFVPYIAYLGWQMPVEAARAYVDGSST